MNVYHYVLAALFTLQLLVNIYSDLKRVLFDERVSGVIGSVLSYSVFITLLYLSSKH